MPRNWRKARREQEEDQALNRMAELTGVDATPLDDGGNSDPVGWTTRTQADPIKGSGHLCLECSQEGGPGQVPVLRCQLAATMPCTRCGRTLEGIRRP